MGTRAAEDVKRWSRRRKVLFAVGAGIGVLAISAVVGWIWVQTPPSSPPAYLETPTEPGEPGEDGYVSKTHTIVIDVPREAFRAWSQTVELADSGLEADGLPTVVGTETIREARDSDTGQAGYRRRIVLSDGHFTAEEILADTPDRFRYQVWGYTNYAGLLIDHAVAEFEFEDQGDRTKVTWTYSFQPTSPIVRPFLSSFVNGPWNELMLNVLRTQKDGAEAAT